MIKRVNSNLQIQYTMSDIKIKEGSKEASIFNSRTDGFLTETRYEQYNQETQRQVLPDNDEALQKEADKIYAQIISKFNENNIDLTTNPKMEKHLRNVIMGYVKAHYDPESFISEEKIDINGIYIEKMSNGYYYIFYPNPNPSESNYPRLIALLRYDDALNPLNTWGEPIQEE